MKTIEVVKKCRNYRILFIAVSSLVLSLAVLVLFHAVFLLIPRVFIMTGMIAPLPLLVFGFASLAVPLALLLYRYPFWGERFYSSIVSEPCTSSDIRGAQELDGGRGFPEESLREEKSLSTYLSEQYSNRVSASISDSVRIKAFLVPGIRRIIIAAAVLVAAVLLSIYRIHFLSDIVTALRTGLPAELISIGPVIQFDRIEAHIIPPAYLDSVNKKVTNLKKKEKILVMEGSKVIIRGALNGIKSGELFFSTQKGLEFFPVTVSKGREFEVSFLAPMKGAFALEFDLENDNRKRTEKSKVYRIEAIPDKPPTIEIHAPEKEHTLVFGHSFGISFTAEDDYGVLEITLCHREAGGDSPHHRELIARFPREAKKQYTSTYNWNPVLREGKKLYQLVYPPGTKKVEYYIEVKDNNLFSSGGITNSKLRYVNFTDILTELKSAISLVEELEREGRELLRDINNTGKNKSYVEKLDSAVEIFSKELKERLPRSNLIRETRDIYTVLSGKVQRDRKKSLEQYVEFLERYLELLKLVMESERIDIISAEMENARNDFESGKHESFFKRMAALAENLDKEYKKELDEIRKLLKAGEKEKARKKMAQLMEKMRKAFSESLQSSRQKIGKMAQQAMKDLNEIIAGAQETIKEQKKNITVTKRRRIQEASRGQGRINKKLEELNRKTGRIMSRYPFSMGSLDFYTRTAKIYGEQSREQLKKKRLPEARQAEENVVRYLESLVNQSKQQRQQMQQIAKGNFEGVMPGNFQERFVFIPKEAIYTVPVDYKEKIIQMSKERSKNTREKEAFWRDVLE
ncbi:MAG: DUF4175 family protein [bacterium]|nr:DUF4175 family protein [bacterium]